MMGMDGFSARRAAWQDRHNSKLGQEIHRQAKFYLGECLQKAVKNRNITERLMHTTNEVQGIGAPAMPTITETEDSSEQSKIVNVIVVDPDTARKTVDSAFNDDYELEHLSNTFAIVELKLHTLLEFYNSLLVHLPEGRRPRAAYGVITPLPDVITAPPPPRNVIQLVDDAAVAGWLKAAKYHPIVCFAVLFRQTNRPNTPTRRRTAHYSHNVLALENAVDVPHDSDSDDDRRFCYTSWLISQCYTILRQHDKSHFRGIWERGG